MHELSENLENREYIQSKIDNWIKAILEREEKLKNEKEYKFIFYCFITKIPVHFCSSSRNI